MNQLTSIQLRPIVAELDDARVATGKELGDCEHRHRLATRKGLLTGNYAAAEETAAAVADARAAHQQSKVAYEEGAALLAEAVSRERAAEQAAVREELADMVSRITAVAAEADAALALLVGKVRTAMKLEAEGRRLCETGLGQSAHGITGVVPESITDAVVYLQSLRSGNPADFAGFVSDRAAVGVARIKSVAGI